MKYMKNIIFLTLFFFASNAQTADSSITWGYQRTSFKGPRSFVLKLTDTMAEIYKTKTGEMLIHGLKIKKPHFKVTSDEGELLYKQGLVRELLGSDESTNPHDLFPILLEVLKEEFGTTLNLSEADFLKEFREAKEELVEFAPYPFVTVRGAPKKLTRMIDTLHSIVANPVGHQLFEDMKACKKELLIYDDKHSLSGGGYTGATRASSGIFEGEGENAYIRFRFDQPISGSHIVGTHGPNQEKIPFLYIDNVFHELVHAKHTMCGTMSFSGAEAQAIHEENIFRESRPETKDWPRRDSRQYEEGVQVWFGYFPEVPHSH
jgi:hypothetical protein